MQCRDYFEGYLLCDLIAKIYIFSNIFFENLLHTIYFQKDNAFEMINASYCSLSIFFF